MANFRYDISPVAAGWQVSCDGVAGSAFAGRNEAVRDTLAAAAALIALHHQVQVRLFEIDGTGRILDPKDAKLFLA